ncbi:MAG: SGNH/GDSL hydrolase family protein [Pseudomonadota bacterium]
MHHPVESAAPPRRRRPLFGLLLLAMLGVAACGGGGSPGSDPLPLLDMRAEAVVLSGAQAASLRRLPERIQAVYGYSDTGARIDFQAGTDWQQAGAGIARTAGSRIPDFAGHQPVLGLDGRFDFSPAPRNPPLTIPYQVYVDYQTRRADAMVQPAPGARRDTRVLCLGDSIAAGAHTIANYFLGTDADSYCGLLRSHLGSGAEVQNPSVPGGTLAAALAGWPALLASQPQTVVLAFGMNDHLAGAAALPAFETRLGETVAQAQAAGARVILVGFMQQNTAWRLEDPAQTVAYNAAIARVGLARGAVFLDVRQLLDRSAPDSNAIAARTGDFMHHPNNHGHRLHFSLLLPHFITAPVAAASLPGYLDPGD